MNAALVPVRSLADAKQRLSARLSDSERTRLAVAMLIDMIDALRGAQTLDRVVVISADAELLDLAEECGAETIREKDPMGLNGAVAFAAARLEADGVRSLLTIPGDVPLLDAGSIDALMDEADKEPARERVALVPSSTGTGTNALVTVPPTVIEPCFEGASLAAFEQACADAGVACTIVPTPCFELDIDTPEDLESLSRSDHPGRAARLAANLLARKGIKRDVA